MAALKARLGYQALLVNSGGNGMMLLEGDAAPLHIGAVGANQPVDVTGAGASGYCYICVSCYGASFSDAAQWRITQAAWS